MFGITVAVVGMLVIFIINSLVMKKNQLASHAHRIDILLQLRVRTLRERLAEHGALSADSERILAGIETAEADPTPANDRMLTQLLNASEELASIASATAAAAHEIETECSAYDREVAAYNRAIANPPGVWFAGMLHLHPVKPAFSDSSDKLR